MSNAIYGRIEGPECAIVFIDEDDVVYGFDKPIYYVKEGSTVNVSVVRRGCIEFSGTVEISTFEVTASIQSAGISDFIPIYDKLLSFEATQSNVSVQVSAFGPDYHLEGEERFEVCLANSARGSIGLYGLIRCAYIVIEDCDSEIVFGDQSYTVNEGTGAVTIHVVRKGYLKSIVSIDVVSFDGNAKIRPHKDYIPVSHTVVFGANDETESSLDIVIHDDYIVENPETFYVELTNINGGLIGLPRIAEILIEDNDVTYRFVVFTHDAYTVREYEGKIILTIIRDGYLDQETSIGIYTQDLTAVSSSTDDAPIEDWDFVPITREENKKIYFNEDQIYQTIEIMIVDDAIYEWSETFEVVLTSDESVDIGVPSVAIVTILSDDLRCSLECQNGGFCISPTECQCVDGYTGEFCEQDIDECSFQPPVCKGSGIVCFNRIGSYECVCTDTDMILEGNTCKATTSQLIGTICATEYENQPIQFVNSMRNTKSVEFLFWADLLETALGDTFGGSIDGYQHVRVTGLNPSDDGICATYVVSLAASSSATESDLYDSLAANINPHGYLGDTSLSLTGIMGNVLLEVNSRWGCVCVACE
ncbi:extracellular matrix organizing protein FRAS1-like [Amphiura filiformis]|uniref:extracellular matrix organizing protein FRAS1-like n=1 Tax=Amphiura filiformis TaxID=82378 RepID=UPI003B21F57E